MIRSNGSTRRHQTRRSSSLLVIGPSNCIRRTNRGLIHVCNSKGQYAVTSKLYPSALTGTTDVSCPGQASRSYNSKDRNGGNSTITSSSSSTTTGGGGDSNNQGSNNNPQVPLGAIIGAAVGGIALLGLLVFLCFRQKNKVRRGEGVPRVRERAGYQRPPLDQSPDGSQTPLAHNYVGEPVYQDNAQFTPFVIPARESAALSYYGSNPTSAPQGGFPQYAPPSSVLPPTKYQRPEDQQRTQSIAWHPGYVYPPPSPAPTSVYQGIAPTGSEPRTSSYSADVVPPATHLSPGQTSTTLRSSVYSDSTSRKSTYTAPYPAQSPGSERSTFAQGSAETKVDPLLNQPVRPTGAAPRVVYQHEDAGVLELPPAYRDYSAPPSAPPNP